MTEQTSAVELMYWIETRRWEREIGAPLGLFSGPHPARRPNPMRQRACRACGCTDDDCSGCIGRTGFACHWIEPDLCSACSN
ncbi:MULTISPECIES: hypothetical protein [unclassified Xanthobacter]|uniref:hypothetical protein n=1 Tax=unclassified Xanthobacter TaxID=2623496 RepID=UPI001F2CE2B6|nr:MULTISPECIES: hypothetical protein [unclassified Xanthobacter]